MVLADGCLEYIRSNDTISKTLINFRRANANTFELNPTFSFTLLGTFVIYAWTRPSRSAWLAVLIVAVGLRLACVRLMDGLGAYYGVGWISWGAFLGIASLMVLAALVARLRAHERKSCRDTFYAGAVFLLCPCSSATPFR
jgi:hypothetical protein